MKALSMIVGVLLLCGVGLAPGVAVASCGDGLLDANEECDPGGGRHRLGNPSDLSCNGGGGDGVPGSQCFYDLTCCKFNCQYANPGPCFDGNDCTTNDACNNVGQCNLGTPVAGGTACGDATNTECNLADTCNGSGTCLSNLQPLGAACGSPSTGECDPDDQCDGAGACVTLTAPAGTPAPTQCGDGNACTADECNGSGGCQNPPEPGGTACGDPTNTQCNLADTCDGVGACQSNLVSAGTACGDPTNTQCNLADTCDGAGACQSNLLAPGAPCGDPSDTGCTNPDTCNGAGACLANDEPPGTSCGDPSNTDCTAPDTCNGSGTCLANDAAPGTACGDHGDTTCTDPDTCNGTGTCLPNNQVDGTPCDDGLFCTITDTCLGGACTGSGDPCAGNPPCQNVCSEITHGCTADAGTSCDDGDACNGVSTCDGAGGCTPGSPLPDGAGCDDHNPCTLLDTCAGETCRGGPTFVARRKAKVNNVATINADIAGWDVAGGVTIGKNGFMPDGTTASAHKVKLGGSTSVFDVRANIVSASGATIRGTTTSPLALPLTSSFCSVPAFVCGGADVVVADLDHQTISPGSYRNVVIGEGGKLDLVAGSYQACSVKAGRTSGMTFLAGGQSTLEVSGNLRILNESFFGPAKGAPWPIVHVGGTSAKYGHYTDVITHTIAPNAKIGTGLDSHYDGTMCGRDLKGAWRVTWSCTDTGP